ncbi:MAG: hypothetical protein A2Y18_03560 [Clostridiales bacterium GWD2_32_19]|nr:MAG: hypothetical protein A2Y18_03560 [Clostridiales bacterium GWD2_32_19]
MRSDTGKVIKLFNEKVDKEKIIEEYIKTRYLFDAGVRVPKVYGIIEFKNQYGIVMQKVIGQTLSWNLYKTPDKASIILEIFAKTLALVNIAEDKEGLLPPQKKYYKDLINKLVDLNKRDRILKILDELPDGKNICHNDVHLNNTMAGVEKLNKNTTNDGIMIDWVGVTKGNPLGNFAFALVFLQCSPSPSNMEDETRVAIDKFIDVYFTECKYDINREELDKWRLVAGALFVGNEEFRLTVTDELLKEKIVKRLKNYTNLMDELLEKY